MKSVMSLFDILFMAIISWMKLQNALDNASANNFDLRNIVGVYRPFLLVETNICDHSINITPCWWMIKYPCQIWYKKCGSLGKFPKLKGLENIYL